MNSKHQRVETFRRSEQGLWILQTYQEESFSLQSINLTASFRDLYEDVTLETVNDTREWKITKVQPQKVDFHTVGKYRNRYQEWIFVFD